MKTLICLAFVVLSSIYAFAQTTSSANGWELSANKWTINLEVLDESGQPVTNAVVWVSYGIPPAAHESKTWDKVEGVTDASGMFTASHSDTGSYSLGIRVTKDGYYQTEQGHDLGTSYQSELWNSSLTIVLKKIGQPIAMYAKREQAKMPKENEAVGFDLMAGDWVTPYGKGTSTDALFTVHRKIISPQEFDADLELTFPNNGDGVVVVPPAPDTGSPLVMPHVAAETGYQSALTWSYHNFTETSNPASGYFFRVRTVMDENGNVKSALYGKIQGEVKFYVGTKAPCAGIGFNYYLNPTPNSRNVEFDPNQNLLSGLQSFERVTEP